MAAFSRLVRFLARDNRIYYGDAILPAGVTDIGKATRARIIRGSPFGKHEVTEQVADVRMLLCPLAREDVPTVRCLGLNYEAHAHEVCHPFISYSLLNFGPLYGLGDLEFSKGVTSISNNELLTSCLFLFLYIW